MTSSNDSHLVGGSKVMVNLRSLISAAAAVPLPVLVEGDTGVGKELVAQALHAGSGRAGALVAFNVCAVSESMFEDALFGHVRGAFTGAHADRPGFIREANGGTLFLDEIGGLSWTLQAKLLRVLETKEFRPVGGRVDVRSDIRVVAATNEPMQTLLAEGRFRRDLAHRLMGVVIRVPSLMERREDIQELTFHFLRKAGHQAASVTPGALQRLEAHAWTGNVRELRQVVEWSAALAQGSLTEAGVQQALAERRTFTVHDDLCYAERSDLRELLVRHQWNADAAAREIGVHRATLYRRMKRLQVIPPALTGRTAEARFTG